MFGENSRKDAFLKTFFIFKIITITIIIIMIIVVVVVIIQCFFLVKALWSRRLIKILKKPFIQTQYFTSYIKVDKWMHQDIKAFFIYCESKKTHTKSMNSSIHFWKLFHIGLFLG